jgi:electron transfer flavoprotein beta subunit
MKILVCVAVTPDTTAKIAFKDGGKVYDTTGVTMIMNPYDEWYALVRAIDLAAATGGSVTLFHVGGPENDQVLRKGLAIGGDRAVRVNAPAQSAAFVAHQIAAYVANEGFDMVFTGKETIDFNGSEVPAMVAELLDWPLLSHVSQLELAGSVATANRDIEGGVEVVEVATPFVLSAAKGLAEQRIPNMMGIMKAKSKPLDVLDAVAVDAGVEVDLFTLPPAKAAVHMIDPNDMDALVQLLHTEAKVI